MKKGGRKYAKQGWFHESKKTYNLLIGKVQSCVSYLIYIDWHRDIGYFNRSSTIRDRTRSMISQ